MYLVSILGVFWVYSDGIPILVLLSSTLWLIWVFFGVENYFLTFSGTIQYLFYPYPVYPVCILGVFCWDPNFGPIELYFMSNMVFFGWGVHL